MSIHPDIHSQMYNNNCLIFYLGNLFDAVSLAAKAALCNTSIPNIVGTYEDGKNIDLQISDDPFDTKPLDARDLPVLVSLCKIGNNYVADPTIEEEICGAGCIVVSVTPKGNVTAVLKKGAGSFMPDTLNEIITVSHSYLLDS